MSRVPPVIRGHRPPRWMIGVWVASVLSGGGLLAGVGTRAIAGGGRAVLLGPATLAGYLQRSAPAGARELRVNGVYGSGHAGAWEFVAHLSWLAPDGSAHGGTLELPQQAGAAIADEAAGLTPEQRAGWTPAELAGALRSNPGAADPLSMLELEVSAGHGGLVSCHGRAAGAPDAAGAPCVEYAESGRLVRSFRDKLVDRPGGDPLSVQRTGKRVG